MEFCDRRREHRREKCLNKSIPFCVTLQLLPVKAGSARQESLGGSTLGFKENATVVIAVSNNTKDGQTAITILSDPLIMASSPSVHGLLIIHYKPTCVPQTTVHKPEVEP